MFRRYGSTCPAVFAVDHAMSSQVIMPFKSYNIHPQYGVVRVILPRTRGYILMTKIMEVHSSNANHTVFSLRYWRLES